MAYSANILGAYELGECIYCATSSFNGTALASVLGPNCHDDNRKELENNRLNNMVAQLYGPKSEQMANRYYNLGCNYLIDLHDEKAAAEYFDKSFALYQSRGDLSKCIWPLASLSFAQYKSREIKKMKETFAAAIELVRRCPDSKNTTRAFEVLICIALISSNQKEAEAFRQIANSAQISTMRGRISKFLSHWSGLERPSAFG